MRILIVAATPMEVAPLVAKLPIASGGHPRLTGYRLARHDVDVLLTGVGMVATAAWCSHVLARTTYDLALNLGVCGSFDRALPPGTVVHVVSDCIAELGAEDGDAFLTLENLSLLGEHDFAFTSGRLVNPSPPPNVALGSLRAVDGITVNTVHGNERSIAAIVERLGPRVESMEGAAFMYACLIHELRFAQVRAVSNVVEKRNRQAWKMGEAVENLGTTAFGILETL
jgi:futalosine hydrolase